LLKTPFIVKNRCKTTKKDETKIMRATKSEKNGTKKE
jgi:hypothetical protein